MLWSVTHLAPRRPALAAAVIPALALSLLAGAAALAALPPAPDAVPAAATVSFVAPANGVPVFGEVPIQIRAEPPAGARVLKVEVFVDGKLLATLLDPPYKTSFDAAEGADAHSFRAKAYTSDGKVATAEIHTPPRLGIQRARVLLVEVYVTVKDRIGRFIMNLKPEDFAIEENGVPQEIALFTTERKPVNIILLLDVSLSMKKESRLETAIKAGQIFVEELEPEDRVSVVTFSDEVHVLQDFTGDRTRILGTIESVLPQRGTALYDAVWSSVRRLGQEEGRRALVLLSDGQDLAFDGMSAGSTHTFDQAVSEALKQQTTIYAIGLGEQLEHDFDFNRLHSAKEVLTRFASDTGGRFFPVRRAGRLKSAFGDVLDELRFQYTIGYHPTNDRRDGTWREIHVGADKSGLNVAARKGYFAPTD